MLLGYNTNGLAHHALDDAVTLLADLGYRAIGLTIDHGVLSPSDDRTPAQLGMLQKHLGSLGMRSAIETGARFLLDPRRKHEPTLVTADADGRERRLNFYRHAIDCAAELGSDCVSIWSGTLHEPAPHNDVMDRLVRGLEVALEYAARRQVVLSFEPEPGMFIDTLEAFAALDVRLGAPELGLTIDVGHLHCQGEFPIADEIDRWRGRLRNVHLDDARHARHEHLMFGEGEIDFAPIIAALDRCGYNVGAYVELSRHSHEAPHAARRSIEYFRALGA
ncbi:MAG: sugar phosphate isomerase/epimerase family protein [Planctomycetota bacterium]